MYKLGSKIIRNKEWLINKRMNEFGVISNEKVEVNN